MDRLPLLLLLGTGALIAAMPDQIQKYIPQDAQLYFGWDIQDHSDYAGSHQAAVQEVLTGSSRFDASSASDDLYHMLMPFLESQDIDPQHVRHITDTFAYLAADGGAFYVREIGYDKENDRPTIPVACLLVQAGNKSDLLATGLQKMFDQYVGDKIPVPMVFDSLDGMLRLTIGSEIEPWYIDQLNITDNSNFAQAMAQLPNAPAVQGWADIAGFLEIIKSVLETQNAPMTFDDIDAIAGIGGIRSIGMSGGFNGQDWEEGAIVHMPGERYGILGALLTGNGISPEALALAPASANHFTATGFDINGTLQIALQTAYNINPDLELQYNDAMGQIREQTGIDLEAFLAGLGHEWISYSDPMITGFGEYGTVIQSPLHNSIDVNDNLTSAIQMANGMITQMLQAQNIPINPQILSQDIDGTVLRRLPLLLANPTWTFEDNMLTLGMSQQSVLGALYEQAALVETPAYQTQWNRLNVPSHATLRSVQYQDLQRSAPYTYNRALMMSNITNITELLSGEPADVRMPFLMDIMPHLGQDINVTWIDENGIVSRRMSTFPGAPAMSGASQGSIGSAVAVTGIGASILLPALGKAREIGHRNSRSSTTRTSAIREAPAPVVERSHRHDGHTPQH